MTIKKLIRRHERTSKFGCGTGGSTPLLATYFNEVIVINYAKKLLYRGQKWSRTDKIRFFATDLCTKKPPIVTVDAAFCINVLLHSNAKKYGRNRHPSQFSLARGARRPTAKSAEVPSLGLAGRRRQTGVATLVDTPMALSDIGPRNAWGQWQPTGFIPEPPLFVWPPRLLAVFKWLFCFLSYLWPWTSLYVLITLSVWLYLQSEIACCATFEFDWIAQLYGRNLALLILMILIVSVWPLRLYVRKVQGLQYKYGAEWLGSSNRKFHYRNQSWDFEYDCGETEKPFNLWFRTRHDGSPTLYTSMRDKRHAIHQIQKD